MSGPEPTRDGRPPTFSCVSVETASLGWRRRFTKVPAVDLVSSGERRFRFANGHDEQRGGGEALAEERSSNPGGERREYQDLQGTFEEVKTRMRKGGSSRSACRL